MCLAQSALTTIPPTSNPFNTSGEMASTSTTGSVSTITIRKTNSPSMSAPQKIVPPLRDFRKKGTCQSDSKPATLVGSLAVRNCLAKETLHRHPELQNAACCEKRDSKPVRGQQTVVERIE
jgi:hypothetical protein